MAAESDPRIGFSSPLKHWLTRAEYPGLVYHTFTYQQTLFTLHLPGAGLREHEGIVGFDASKR